MEGGRYGSVHGPSGMGFDLRSADRHTRRSYDGKTVGYGRLAKINGDGDGDGAIAARRRWLPIHVVPTMGIPAGRPLPACCGQRLPRHACSR